MNESHRELQHPAVHNVAKVQKPDTKSNIKILWPSMTRLKPNENLREF